MELQELDVFIAKDGTVRVEVRGVKGGGCLEITKPLEDALGGEIQSREMTEEMYSTAEELENTEHQYGG